MYRAFLRDPSVVQTKLLMELIKIKQWLLLRLLNIETKASHTRWWSNRCTDDDDDDEDDDNDDDDNLSVYLPVLYIH